MFKAQWEKTSTTQHIAETRVKDMLRLAYPKAKLCSSEMIAGGCANLNFKLMLVDNLQPLMLRIYLRDKAAAYREQKLAALLKQTVPVPLIHFIGELDLDCFAISEYMPGIPLRDLLLSDTSHDINAIMQEVGTMLAKIAAHEFPQAGFFDKELNVIPHLPANDYLVFANACLQNEAVLAVLTAEAIAKINRAFAQHGHLLPNAREKHLVHADFDPANILVANIDSGWRVSGVLDWEFSFSGSILWDVATMLRYADKMPPEFQDAFLVGLTGGGMTLPSNWRITVKLLNLLSLLDCLKRSDPNNHPKRCTDIRNLIEYILVELNSAQQLRRVEVVGYDSRWPALFEAEAANIKRALGNNCITIHHIGSTSVPGLVAKPIIDLVPVVHDITAVDQTTAAMETLGYEARGEYGMLFRRFFQKKGFNIHIFEQASAEIDGHLLFRDWMRMHAVDREGYAMLKQELALRYPQDIYQYVFGKDAFVRDIHSKTGFNGLRIVNALTPREWQAA